MGNVKVCLAVHVCSCALLGLSRFITWWVMSKCVLQSMCVVVQFWIAKVYHLMGNVKVYLAVCSSCFLLPWFYGWSQGTSCSQDMYSIAFFIAKADEWCQAVLRSLTLSAVILCQAWCQGILCNLSAVILCKGWQVMSDVQMYLAVQMCSCAVFHCQGWWVMSRYFVQSNSKCCHSLQRLMSHEWCQGVSCNPNV